MAAAVVFPSRHSRPMDRPLRTVRWLAAALFAGVFSRAGEPAPAAAGPVVELPAFVITETKPGGAPWRYARAEGFEIISQVGDDSTQAVFEALWRGPRLTLPPEFHPRLSTPTAVIIFDQDPDRGSGPGALGSVRLPTEQSAHWTNVIKRTQPDREVFSVNLRGRYFTRSSTFRFDLHTLLRLRTPAPPPWVHEALYGAYGIYREGIDYPERGTHSSIVRALWCEERELMRAEQLAGPALDFFLTPPEKRKGSLAVRPPLFDAIADPAGLWNGGLPGDTRAPAENARWAATCALFARWALYARDGARRDGFWRLVNASSSRPVDETVFRECLGLGFAEARAELAWYLPIAITEVANRAVEPLRPPRLQIRPATAAEVARVRGDWERGEAAILAGSHPEISARYAAQAGRTLRTAHAANPDDAELAAALGLLEFESGDNARALELLTAATAGGQSRPRAWFTLAHLRLLGAGPARGSPPLTAAEAAPILAPLQEAWRLEPAMAVTYELLAELWRRCPELPAAETATRLREGQRRFPRDTRLLLAAFRACVERGARAEALAMLDEGLPLVTDPVMRDRLQRTREALAAAAGKPR